MNKWKMDDCAPNTSKIPEVGQFWKHSGPTIYVRIPDHVGKGVLSNISPEYVFFSMNDCGGIVNTSKSSNDIHLLDVSFKYAK